MAGFSRVPISAGVSRAACSLPQPQFQLQLHSWLIIARSSQLSRFSASSTLGLFGPRWLGWVRSLLFTESIIANWEYSYSGLRYQLQPQLNPGAVSYRPATQRRDPSKRADRAIALTVR